MELKIPTSFQLASCDWKVDNVEDIDDRGLGRTYSPLGLIKLANTWQGKIIAEDAKLNTFYHELVHAMLDTSEYKDLSNDEPFVQALANLFIEYLKTANFNI